MKKVDELACDLIAFDEVLDEVKTELRTQNRLIQELQRQVLWSGPLVVGMTQDVFGVWKCDNCREPMLFQRDSKAPNVHVFCPKCGWAKTLAQSVFNHPPCPRMEFPK